MKLLLPLLITLFVPAVVMRQGTSPQQVADELLAADRAFSAASAKTDLIAGISAMFASDVAMPAPGGIAYGSQKAIEALRSNNANAGATATWTPARVAISTDGFHGFTAGFMTITRADGSVNPAKYLAYWEKQKDGWRVRAYKRAAAKEAAPETKVTYLLPPRIMVSMLTPAKFERDLESLLHAERSFAAEAQQIGLGPAFRKYGSPEAINLGGGGAAFVWGNDAIAGVVGQNEPATGSSVNWAPEKAIIAITGDFGVTIGYITPNKPGPDGKTPPSQPFFTIWRKNAEGVWRYIAE